MGQDMILDALLDGTVKEYSGRVINHKDNQKSELKLKNLEYALCKMAYDKDIPEKFKDLLCEFVDLYSKVERYRSALVHQRGFAECIDVFMETGKLKESVFPEIKKD